MSVPAVEFDHLSKIFRPPLVMLRRLLGRRAEDVQALDDVSLRIERGEIFGVVGRNGQGKTTLIKIAASLILPTTGAVRVFGHDSARHSDRIRQSVGLVSADERTFYWRLDGWQNLLFFARLYGLRPSVAVARIEELAGRFGVVDLLGRRFYEYSTGNKQRLAIVRALLPDPPLLMLDEPTRSLDPLMAEELRRGILSWAHAEGKTVIVTTHNLPEIERLCDRVAVFSRGSVRACGSLAELRRQYGDQEEVTLTLRDEPDGAVLSSVHEATAECRCERTEAGVQLTFRRQRGDDALHSILERLVAGGVRVMGCSTRTFGLQEILEQVEGQEP